MPNVVKTGGGGGGTKVFIDGVQSSEKELNLKVESFGWATNPISETPYPFYMTSRLLANDGNLHFLGGQVTGAPRRHAKCDDNVWSVVSEIPYDFMAKSGATLDCNGDINILGSWSDANGQSYYHYKFDGTTWSSVSVIPIPQKGGCSLTDKEGYIHTFYNKQHYKFKDVWTNVEALNATTMGTSSIYMDFSDACQDDNGKFYIAGSNGSYVYIYDSNNGTWSNTTTTYASVYSGYALLREEVTIFRDKISVRFPETFQWRTSTWCEA